MTLAAAVTLSVAPAGAAPSVTFAGLGADGEWSTSGNWAPSTPSTGDALSFPSPVVKQQSDNDIAAGTVFDSIAFDGSYHITGNTIGLSNGLTVTSGHEVVDTPLTLTADQAITNHGIINLASVATGTHDIQLLTDDNLLQVKTLTGSGTVTTSSTSNGTVEFDGGSFSGTITLGHGFTFWKGPMPDAAVVVSGSQGGELTGTGSLGPLTVQSGGEVVLGSPPGLLQVFGDYDLGGAQSESIDACTDNTKYGTLVVHGAVKLHGALKLFGGGAAPGQDCLIVDNDGSDPVSGTFTGLPEGSLVFVPGNQNDLWMLTYQGGDGNDVVLQSVGGVAFPGGGAFRFKTADKLSVDEGGLLQVMIMRLNGGAAAAHVELELVPGGSSATEPADFAPTQVVDFPAGIVWKSVYIDTVDDGIVEGNEDFELALGDVFNASITAPSFVFGTIVDGESDITTTTPPPTTGLPTTAPGTPGHVEDVAARFGAQGQDTGSALARTGAGLGTLITGAVGFALLVTGAALQRTSARLRRRREPAGPPDAA